MPKALAADGALNAARPMSMMTARAGTGCGGDTLVGNAGNDQMDGGAGSNKLRPGPDQNTALASVRVRRSEAAELPDKLHEVLEDALLLRREPRRK